MIALIAGMIALAPSCAGAEDQLPGRHPLAPTVCVRHEIAHPCNRACRQRRHMRRVVRPYRG